MKTTCKLITCIALFASLNSFAQDAAQSASPETLQKCKENNSVFYEFAKGGNYADAAAPWLELYNACPEYSKNIYKYGTQIVNWQIEQEKDATKKAALIDRLMGVYDNRMKYFGDDAVLPADRVLGLKAIDYYNLPTPNDPLKKQAYAWMEKSINALGNKVDASFIQYYILMSAEIYKKEPAHLDKLIQDYIKTNDILLANTTDSTAKNYKNYLLVKQANNQVIAQSKALSTETLDNIYAKGVEENKSNLAYLNSVIALYKAVNGVESSVYFSAAAYAHKIEPTEESAVGCANMANKNKEYAKCISYLEDATKLSTSTINKASYQLTIASIYFDKLNSYSKAREHAYSSLEYNPNQGEPYILIGNMYASSTGIYGNDAVLAKTIYYVAVDKYIKAKQVDASVAEKANTLINRYSRYFPEDNDVFMHPDLEKGKSFTVGGWIGESTIVR
jgi:hypothetical protein